MRGTELQYKEFSYYFRDKIANANMIHEKLPFQLREIILNLQCQSWCYCMFLFLSQSYIIGGDFNAAVIDELDVFDRYNDNIRLMIGDDAVTNFADNGKAWDRYRILCLL